MYGGALYGVSPISTFNESLLEIFKFIAKNVNYLPNFFLIEDDYNHI